ncbi:MAG: MFS transporter [Planctomycetota bacterium]|jgi:FSR family fosmidomycin resistance protein-like MFS transporter
MEHATKTYRKQWSQLLALTGAHFVLDSVPGLMHTVLPAFQESFQLSVAAGATLLTVFLVAANGIQVAIGHIRPKADRPLMLYAGFILICSIALFTIVPPDPSPLVWLCLISAVCGIGVGMTHPESLRAVHRFDRISSAVSSSVFMAGGVAGFAFGGWISTHLYKSFGLGSLFPFCIASVVALLVIIFFRIRLAVDRDQPKSEQAHSQGPRPPFWLIIAMATLVAGSMTVFAWIIPQHINQLGVDLTLGGLSVSVLSVSGGVGAVVMSKWAHRIGEFRIVRWMLAAGVPFIIAYLFLVSHRWALVLLFVGGFFCFGVYPILVSIARGCGGTNLGQRMGWVVGGVWLLACGLPMLLGPIANHFGTEVILFCIPIGFVLSLTLSIVSGKRD